ncbi:MAG: decarboxylase [Mycobacterium sp.]|nr:decarboxylase [Mycobacterium sp.]
MNGAESLVRTLVACGVTTCFANPGTSEMHFVAAVDEVEGMRTILGLFEGAVTGMADGYGRMAESPAATLLHLGPGLANGLANLHNARKAATPVVNIVGNHATYRQQYDSPLASDVEGFARPVSGWMRSSRRAEDVASDAALAVQAALQPPGQIATLILPADTAWSDAEGAATPLPRPTAEPVSELAVSQAAQAAMSGKNTLILIRGAALKEPGLRAAAQVAAATGARVACDTFAPRWQRGAGRPLIEQIPYFAEQIVDYMAGVEALILVGANPPVSFFAYPGKPSWCTPEDCRILHLARPHEDGTAALQALAEAVGATRENAVVAQLRPPELPTGLAAERLHGRRGDRPLAARRGHHLRRSGHVRVGVGCGHRTRGTPRLPRTHRWLDRTGDPAVHRRRRGLPRPQSRVPTRRWRRHVHPAGAVDAGPRKP